MKTANSGFFGLLTRLRKDARGNTLAMVAAAMIPLAGLLGGGIDMSRIYLTKTRLQQACDAGALTGRKVMGAGSWTTTANTGTQAQANRMFDANFLSGAYGSGTVTRAFTESNGKVTGTASTVLPMTLMKIFAQPSQTIEVTCDAEMRIPNTDVMFVLDVTGSMAQTNSGDTAPKIDGLKKAVKCFYEALAKVNTTADCGSTPSGGNSASVQLRFGFVPYSSNVNVGKLLPNSYLADNWSYQSREAKFKTVNVQDGWNNDGTPSVYSTSTSNNNYGSWSNVNSYTNKTESWCDNNVPADTASSSGSEGSPYDQTNWTSGSSQIVQWSTDQNYSGYSYNETWTKTSGRYTSPATGDCVYQRRTRSYKFTRVYRKTNSANYVPQEVFDAWDYKQKSFNVSALKAGGSSWNGSVALPGLSTTKDATTSVDWNGCIEERQTVPNSDGTPAGEFSPIPTDAYDLNIDMIPSTGNVATQWGPSLPNAIWGRYTSYSCGRNGRDTCFSNSWDPVTTSSDLDRNYGYACPAEAKRLATYATATNFESYVDGLSPTGNTYHDIGILWGARLMSPTGLFADDNDYTSSGGAIERHMVFMTDGDTNTSNTDYTAYGVPWWDRRQTNAASAPSNSLLDDVVDARLPALCTAIKNMNITLWVISYGTSVSDATATRLTACASTGKFFSASNTTTLIANFKSIADEISQLRLTK